MSRRWSIPVFFTVTLAPLVMGLGYSLLYSLGLIGLMSDGFTLRYWKFLFSENEALGSIFYTLALTLASLLLAVVLALLTAWYLHGKARGNFYKLLFVPLTFPPLVAAFAWKYLLAPGGILSRVMYQLQLSSSMEDFPRMVNDYWSTGILVTHIFLVFPLFTLLFSELARKEKMRELWQSAETLGSSRFQFFRRVFAPLLLFKARPVLALYGIFLFGTYEVPLLLGRSSPRVITVFVKEKLTQYNLAEIPVGHTMASLYCILVLLIVALLTHKKSLRLL